MQYKVKTIKLGDQYTVQLSIGDKYFNLLPKILKEDCDEVAASLRSAIDKLLDDARKVERREALHSIGLLIGGMNALEAKEKVIDLIDNNNMK